MLRKLLLPKSYVILTFVVSFLLIAAYSFSYIMTNNKNTYLAICSFFHITSPDDFMMGYGLTAGFVAVIILIVFGYLVQKDFFSSTSSLGAEGSCAFVLFFYAIKLFIMILFGALCLFIFFILSIYTVIFKIIVHEPLD